MVFNRKKFFSYDKKNEHFTTYVVDQTHCSGCKKLFSLCVYVMLLFFQILREDTRKVFFTYFGTRNLAVYVSTYRINIVNATWPWQVTDTRFLRRNVGFEQELKLSVFLTRIAFLVSDLPTLQLPHHCDQWWTRTSHQQISSRTL